MTPLDHDPATSSSNQVRDARFNLRANAVQDNLIRRAAEARGQSVSQFVLDSATAEAEQVLADRRWFQLDEDAWRDFQAALDRPAIFKPRLNSSLNSDDPFVE
jgi:uncharacterized protein (DUF1778 family)